MSLNNFDYSSVYFNSNIINCYINNFNYPLKLEEDIKSIPDYLVNNYIEESINNIELETKKIILYKLILKERNKIIENPKLNKKVLKRLNNELNINSDSNIHKLINECVKNEIDDDEYINKGKNYGLEDETNLMILTKMKKAIDNNEKDIDFGVGILFNIIEYIEDNGIKYLSEFFIKMEFIENIDLQSNRIKYKGMKVFSKNLKYLPNLTVLNLGSIFFFIR